MEDYKQDVISTRKGYVGSSDAKMLAHIAESGSVPKSAYERLAVVKGLTEAKQIPYVDAVRYGDEIEQALFEHLHSIDERYESNPKWVSKKYSRGNVKCLTHPDIVLKDDEKKILYIYEVKTSKFTYNQVRYEYKEQLYHHFALGQEIAHELGKGWSVKVFLAHYNTDGLDLSIPQPFDTERLTVKHVRRLEKYDLAKAMDIVDAFLADFNEYYDGDEIPYECIPAHIKCQFDNVTTFLAEIKERESKVDEFKRKLCDFMVEKRIKSIKNDYWNITLVNATEQVSFDGKKFISDFSVAHPRKAEKLKKEYEKRVTKGAYVKILLKDKDK